MIFGNEDPLASPKVTGAERNLLAPWVKVYTSFSSRFVSDALDRYCRSKKEIVYDPMSGAGTVAVEVARRGLKGIAREIDPFSYILTKARTSPSVETGDVERILRRIDPKRPVPNQANDIFTTSTLVYIDALMDIVCEELECIRSDAWETLQKPRTQKSDVVAVTIAAACFAAGSAAKIVDASNPVWFRAARDGERVQVKSLEKVVPLAASHLLALNRKAFPPTTAVTPPFQVFYGDSRLPLRPRRKPTLVITSPPYLNRLDYTVKHKAQIALISQAFGLEAGKALRQRLIGTTLVRQDRQASLQWGNSCTSFLNEVWNHDSYASRRYYHGFYVQYFSDLSAFLSALAADVAPTCIGLVVIQDSYFKDIRIPIDQIFPQMAKAHGITATTIQAESVRTHMGLISPKQRENKKKGALTEYVFELKF